MNFQSFGPHIGRAALMIFAVALSVPALSAPAIAADGQPSTPIQTCAAPSDLTQLNGALPRTARRIAANAPLTIVAIGSSSTAGAGASSPAASYPSRLAVELKERYPTVAINVINHGANGEDATEMMARFERNVIAEKPDLVLWQVGTNALLHDRSLDEAGSLIVQGLDRLKRDSVDVVLIDSQYAPKVLEKPHLGRLRKIMAGIAKRANVPTFQRFEVMRHWREKTGMAFNTFLSSDNLHMNDWSYACVAKLLAGSIGEAAARASLTAQAGAR